MRGRQRSRRQGRRRTQSIRRTFLRAAHGLPREMSPNSQAKRPRPRQPHNDIPLAFPLRLPHPSLPPIPQAPRTGLAFCQPLVVGLLKMPMVMIDTTLPFYNLYFFRAFANVLTCSLMCFPIPTTCSHIFVLPLFAFCTMRCIYPDLLTVIAVLHSSP
jgi:hypothetical protein